MSVEYNLFKELPDDWLKCWSQATISEPHLLAETPTSLQAHLLASAVATIDNQPVGFAGLVEARTHQGYGCTYQNKRLVELGGAYVHPSMRGRGVWRQLLAVRIQYARCVGWKMVCVSTNPTVHTGLIERGALPLSMANDSQLLELLCLNCETNNGCKLCPLSPGSAWLVE